MADQALQEENRRLQEQLAQTAAVFARRSESVNPEQEERARQHEIRLKRLEYEANERTKKRAIQHKLEMTKLQLQIEQAKAGNKTPATFNITQ